MTSPIEPRVTIGTNVLTPDQASMLRVALFEFSAFCNEQIKDKNNKPEDVALYQSYLNSNVAVQEMIADDINGQAIILGVST